MYLSARYQSKLPVRTSMRLKEGRLPMAPVRCHIERNFSCMLTTKAPPPCHDQAILQSSHIAYAFGASLKAQQILETNQICLRSSSPEDCISRILHGIDNQGVYPSAQDRQRRYTEWLRRSLFPTYRRWRARRLFGQFSDVQADTLI